MNRTITCTINGKKKDLIVDVRQSLLEVLREQLGLTSVNSAEAAVTRAHRTHNQKSRRALAITLADIGATRLLTDRSDTMVTNQPPGFLTKLAFSDFEKSYYTT